MREETDLKRLLYFVSNSKNKYEELKQMAEGTSYDIRWYQYSIKELQTDKVEELLRHKALAAFKKIKRPVIVDHTILEKHLITYRDFRRTIFLKNLEIKK